MTGKEGLQLSIPLVTVDKAQVWKSVRALSALPVEVLCFGHGEPILERARERMKGLIGEKPD